MEKNRNFEIVNSVLAGVVVFIYYCLVSLYSRTNEIVNIKMYIIAIVVYLAVYIILDAFLNFSWYRNILKLLTTRPACILLIASFGVVGLLTYLNEKNDHFYYFSDYLRHQAPVFLYFLILLCVAFISLRLINQKISTDMKVYRFLISAVLICIEVYGLYSPNFLGEIEGTTYHIHAYTNSICNVLRFVPYSDAANSIYGHYAIFYMPLVKMLHLVLPNTWTSITIAICIVGIITFSLQKWVLHKLIKNDVIFFLAIGGMLISEFQLRSYQYYQTIPHRFFFQAVIIAGCIYALENQTKKWFQILMWIASLLSVVWNFETGLICSLIWAICWSYIKIKQQGKWSLWVIIRAILFFILALAGAYIFVNLYNLAVGGEWISINTFTYPMGFGQEYKVIDTLQIKASRSEVLLASAATVSEIAAEGTRFLAFPMPWNGYFYLIVIAMSPICLLIKKVIKLKSSDKEFMLFINAVMAVALFTYCINHMYPQSKMFVAFPVIITLAMMCEFALEKGCLAEEGFKTVSVSGIAGKSILIILTAVFMAGVFSVPISYKMDYYTIHDKETIDSFLYEVNELLPENTVGFGQGVPELFAALDRHPKIYIMDWSDMTSQGIEKLNQYLSENDYENILVADWQESYIPEGYVKTNGFAVDDINGGNLSFYLFSKE